MSDMYRMNLLFSISSTISKTGSDTLIMIALQYICENRKLHVIFNADPC